MERGDLSGAILDGRYRVIEPVAEGAMGVVYRAERMKLGRIVAIKVLHDVLPDELSGRKRFEIEAMAMAKLEHPHCASVLDVGVHGARPFVVMDFVSGQNLKELITSGPLPIPRAVEIVRQVLSGLAHAHEHGVIHRDIKPANLVLSHKTGLGDHVKILDFGLARLHDTGQNLTSGLAVGTPAYMSPEQIRGQKIDQRADLYACGVLLFELLTGQKPYHSDSDDPIEVCKMHLSNPIPRLDSKLPGVDFGELETVILKALAKRAARRYLTAEEFAGALAEAVGPVRRVAMTHTSSSDAGRTEPLLEVGSSDVMEAEPEAAWHGEPSEESGSAGAARTAIPTAGVVAEAGDSVGTARAHVATPPAGVAVAEPGAPRTRVPTLIAGSEALGDAAAARVGRALPFTEAGGAGGPRTTPALGSEALGDAAPGHAKLATPPAGVAAVGDAPGDGPRFLGATTASGSELPEVGEGDAAPTPSEPIARAARAKLATPVSGAPVADGARAKLATPVAGTPVAEGARAKLATPPAGVRAQVATPPLGSLFADLTAQAAARAATPPAGTVAVSEGGAALQEPVSTFLGIVVPRSPSAGARGGAATPAMGVAVPKPAPAKRPWLRPAAVIGGIALACAAAFAILSTRGARDEAPAPAPAPAASPPVEPVRDIVARANELAAQGDKDGALELLARTRRQLPQTAETAVVSYAAGRINFSKFYWTEGLKSFRDAIKLEPSYRSDPELIKTVLRGFLTTPSFNEDLATFLREDIGAAARPMLEETARDHPSPATRTRAATELRRYK